jgi:hypothetical protein
LVEKQKSLKIRAVRIDNATELKALLKEWLTTDGIQEESTISHSSFQNRPAERSIQMSENDFRAMLKDQNLPIEFWDEAVVSRAYVRNWIINGPKAGDKIFSPYEAFYGQPTTINHFWRFGCQAISYVDPKSLLAYDKRNPKQVDKGRLGVFMGYVNETTKQWWMYSPDLGRTITVSTINFFESKKGGDLNLRIRGAHPQGTPSDPTDRNPTGRPKEILTNIELPPKEKLNNFEIRIPTYRTESKLGGNNTTKVNQHRTKDPQLAQSTNNESASHKRPASEEELDTRDFKKIKVFLAKLSRLTTSLN